MPAAAATTTNLTAAPSAAAAPRTLAEDLHASPAVRSAIETLVKEQQARAVQLSDVRPATSPQSRQAFEDFMKHAGDLRGRALLYPYIGSGLGRGALVELMDGSVKWDMICSIGVNFFGHSDPDLTAVAARACLSDVVMEGNLLANADAYKFAELLLSAAGKHSRLKHIYMATSGCMANENALKICYQKHAPAPRVIAFRDCFMGRSVTMSQIGDAAANRIGIPLSTLVDYLPFYDPAAAAAMGQQKYIEAAVGQLMTLIERYPRQHACFIFELVQGEGGFNTAPAEYFKALMKTCKAHGIAVWDDEIQTFGRTTSLFAYEALGLGEYVDVLCVGKLTQVCATLYTAEYNPGPGLLSGTFIGGPVPYAVGTRIVERLQQPGNFGPDGRFAKQHKAFGEQVKALAAKHPAWFPRTGKWGAITDLVGGTGGMMRFTTFGGDKDLVMKACRTMFDEGVIVFYCGHGPYHVRMLPPLGVFDEKDWPRVFACVERGLAKVGA